VGRLITLFRSEGQKVGVLAVDPSSTYTGGAFLGDRVRIQEHATFTRKGDDLYCDLPVTFPQLALWLPSLMIK